jgi:hypothetical protein
MGRVGIQRVSSGKGDVMRLLKQLMASGPGSHNMLFKSVVISVDGQEKGPRVVSTKSHELCC